jgi:hypothetical protein
VEGTEVIGNLFCRSNVISIYPGVRFSTFRINLVFKTNIAETGQQVLQIQTSGFQTWVSPELNFVLVTMKHVSFTTQAIYTPILENAEDAVQLPKVFINSQLAYANIWFKGNFDFQVGLDCHWKSAYYTPSYDVTVQQFYVQQTYTSPGFPVIDAFLNFKIKRARLLLKYNNILKAFTNYADVPTPFYPGIKNILDFGFDWSFYD